MCFIFLLNNNKSWAYCYRKHAGLNTDTHFEQLHRTLKGKTVKRLDKAISAIMTLVRDKLNTLHKGRYQSKYVLFLNDNNCLMCVYRQSFHETKCIE